MKKKILIMTAAALLTLGLATVSAQSPAPAEQAPEEIICEIVDPQRYEAGTVDADGNVPLDVEICLVGDVNMNGVVNIQDCQRLYEYMQGNSITDAYQLAIADVNANGTINIQDCQRLYEHMQGNSLHED